VTAAALQVRADEVFISDDAVIRKFKEAGQGHVFRFLPRLDFHRRGNLLRGARSVDLDLVGRLASGGGLAKAPPPPQPLGDEVWTLGRLAADGAARARHEALGLEALRSGKVACLTLAGGQGTRLGWQGPKGCYPIGPGDRTLFDIHAAGVAAATKAAGKPVPWVILVSPSTEEATRSYIRRRGLPGVEPASVRLVCQGTLPVLDDDGRLLLEAEDRIALSPDGHGGVLRALRLSGTMAWLVNLGIEEIAVGQVDNPLAPAADPLFLGLHRAARGQMSSKVFLKGDPAERVGVVVRLDGRPGVIEYSELPRDLAEKRDSSGRLTYWAANMASHVLSVHFAAAVAYRGLPVHRVRKKAPFLDAAGNLVEPTAPNAFKYETFLFDALPMADEGVVLEVDRSAQFAPVKNASGTDSPGTARILLQAAGKWAP
jgi:UDP-N-acetylglucosamine/UDP-N-acetylgalactosamine diphosphorylase